MIHARPKPSIHPGQAADLEAERRLLDRGRDDIRQGRALAGDDLKQRLAELASSKTPRRQA